MKEKLFDRFFNLLDEASDLLQEEVDGRLGTLDFAEDEA